MFWMRNKKIILQYALSSGGLIAYRICQVTQAFKWALLFLFFLLFPTFLVCSYFSLLFHENALLSLLFHSKMSSTRKNPEIFTCSLRSLRLYELTSMFIQGVRRLTPKTLLFNLKVSLFGPYYCHRYNSAHLI